MLAVLSFALTLLLFVQLLRDRSRLNRHHEHFATAPIPLLIIDRHLDIIERNACWRSYVNPADHRAFFETLQLNAQIERAFSTGETQVSQPISWPQDPQRWTRVHITPLKVSEDGAGEVIIRFIDATTEKRETSLAAQRANINQSILDHAKAVVYVKDNEGRYMLVNARWSAALGIAQEKVIGFTDNEVFEPEIAKVFTANDRLVLEEGQSLQLEESAPHADGMHSYLSVKFPIRDEAGKIIALGGISTDITESKKSEAEKAALLVREKTANEASVMKSIFLANMSHELRTPINGVMGLGDLLVPTLQTDEQRMLAEGIVTSAENLLTLVNDILDLTKAETGKIELESVDVDLRRILKDVETTGTLIARRKGLDLDFAVDAQVAKLHRGDPTRIRQVLMNLTNNALKFTWTGSVSISVTNAANGIRFDVVDTGVGIDPHAQAKLFTPFSQADASTTRKYGGSGLGLSISKHLVVLMGGDIGVDSQEGRGSKFWFTLPLEVVEEKAQLPSVAEPQPFVAKRLRILIAEDNKTNQVIAAKMLHKLGHTTEIVENGREAIAALERSEFDVIFMDCQMPELDGYEASRLIRAGKTANQIPIIALTANAMRGDREKCLEAGMTDYIAKPIKSHDLEHAITRLLLSA